jgi:hypothetical protein
MNRDIIFVGPSLSAARVRELLPDAVILPPAMQGELLSVARSFRPRSIGLIDGLWHAVPSVWHKEITSALGMGIPVYGAASMGALRAVECAPWGAMPVGKIAARYGAEDLDDDEVVLLHGDADAEFKPLTVPMINLRFTIESLVECGKLDATEGALWVAILKNVFYGNRSWGMIAETLGPEAAEVLRNNYIDQKAEDAEELCRLVAGDVSIPAAVRAERAAYGFGAVLRGNDLIVPCGNGAARLHQVASVAGPTVATAAMDRALALQYARKLGLDADVEGPEPDADWCAQNDLTLDEGRRLMQDESILQRARELLLHVDAEYGLVPRVNDLLRVSNQYRGVKAVLSN